LRKESIRVELSRVRGEPECLAFQGALACQDAQVFLASQDALACQGVLVFLASLAVPVFLASQGALAFPDDLPEASDGQDVHHSD
jgi:hypothetical protein